MPTPCACGPGTHHHPSCRFRRTNPDRPTRAGRPVTVRKLGPWWLWYCQIPACLDHAGHGYFTPAAAADAGRAHHHLWHTNPAA